MKKIFTGFPCYSLNYVLMQVMVARFYSETRLFSYKVWEGSPKTLGVQGLINYIKLCILVKGREVKVAILGSDTGTSELYI